MSEINTVDNARTAAIDARRKAAENSTEAAKQSRENGNSLPVLEDSRQGVSAPQAQQIDQNRSVRVEQAVEQLNEYVQSLQRDLRFSLDQDLGRAVVRVIDSSTQEVIRQIPNETALQLARNLKAIQEVRAQESADLVLNGSGSNASAEASLGLINTRI